MRGWEIDIDISDFYLELYRDELDVPRAVATRRVLTGIPVHPDPRPRTPSASNA